MTIPGGVQSGSGKVILAAIGINTANFVMKLVAWLLTGSHALFSEAIHSAADTVNQVWSLTQFYFVDFSQSRFIVKRVFSTTLFLMLSWDICA